MSRLFLILRKLNPLWWLWARLLLSRAKARSLTGHPRMALRLARSLRGYAYDRTDALAQDGAPANVVADRQAALLRLESETKMRAPRSAATTAAISARLSDLAFVSRYRTPFQFEAEVGRHLAVPNVAVRSDGVMLEDLDGNRSYDLGGSYGVNLFGNDFYKDCIARGVERAQDLGVVLGPHHPVVADNVERLAKLSGLDEVSFHMSGTEAVMQAVRLARYHTGRRYVVRFAGAYHGWWDGVQVGPGNPLPGRDVLTLAEMSARTLGVLRMRHDIACVLVNPLQAMTPNASPSADNGLITGLRHASYDKAEYRKWLLDLREVCTQKGIALVFDEVFLGFRLARGGVQEYFGVQADLVTYGKTLGGGLPVGVLCGRRELMRRFSEGHPANICFARGTFNAHPYVMATMNELLRYLDSDAASATWKDLDLRWDRRAAALNARLTDIGVPVRVANMTSVFTTLYTQPGRYHWMFQYYLRAQGLSLGWIGTGRFIFSHDYTDVDFAAVVERVAAAARFMRDDGWFYSHPAVGARHIRRRVFWEVVRATFGGKKSPRPTLKPPQAGSPTLVDVAARGHERRPVV